MKASKHRNTLLEIMRTQGRVTAGQRGLGISNANQYLGELKRAGVIKDKPADGERFKWWYIVDFKKAAEILKLAPSANKQKGAREIRQD